MGKSKQKKYGNGLSRESNELWSPEEPDVHMSEPTPKLIKQLDKTTISVHPPRARRATTESEINFGDDEASVGDAESSAEEDNRKIKKNIKALKPSPIKEEEEVKTQKSNPKDTYQYVPTLEANKKSKSSKKIGFSSESNDADDETPKALKRGKGNGTGGNGGKNKGHQRMVDQTFVPTMIHQRKENENPFDILSSLE